MKKKTLMSLIFIVLLISSLACVPAIAMQGLSEPGYGPIDLECNFMQQVYLKNSEYATDWGGAYYAEHYGFDLIIDPNMGDSGLCFYVQLQNYNGGSWQTFMCYDDGAGGIRDTDGKVIITRDDADHLHIVLSDDFCEFLYVTGSNLYMECKEADLVRIERLLENQTEDEWNGAYYYDDDINESRNILNVKQLYGTNDYMTYWQSIDKYNVETDGRFVYFYTQKGDVLVRGIPANGVVLLEDGYFPLLMDSDKNIHSFVQIYGEADLDNLENEYSETYKRVWNKPLWETDSSGIIMEAETERDLPESSGYAWNPTGYSTYMEAAQAYCQAYVDGDCFTIVNSRSREWVKIKAEWQGLTENEIRDISYDSWRDILTTLSYDDYIITEEEHLDPEGDDFAGEYPEPKDAYRIWFELFSGDEPQGTMAVTTVLESDGRWYIFI